MWSLGELAVFFRLVFNVALVISRRPEVSIGSVEVVQDAEDSEAFGELHVVVIVRLGNDGETEEIVAAVGVQHVHHRQSEHEPSGEQVRADEHHRQSWG